MAVIQFKPSIDSNNKPVVQAVVQNTVSRMTNEDRLALGHGPTFTVLVGEAIVAQGIPKRSAMAMSGFFNDGLTKYPQSASIKLNPAQVDERHIRILADFITSNSKTHKPFGLRVPETLVELVNLYRHADMLGMGPHTGGLRAKILGYLATEFSVPPVPLTQLVKLPATDRCYQVAVRKIEGLIHIGAINKHGNDWKTWAQDHAEFVAAMEAFKVERQVAAAENRKHQQEMLEAQRAQDWEDSFPPLV